MASRKSQKFFVDALFVNFIMFRKLPNKKFPIDLEQEKFAIFGTREICERVCRFLDFCTCTMYFCALDLSHFAYIHLFELAF